MWLHRCNLYKRGAEQRALSLWVGTSQFISTKVTSHSVNCISISDKAENKPKEVSKEKLLMYLQTLKVGCLCKSSTEICP